MCDFVLNYTFIYINYGVLIHSRFSEIGIHISKIAYVISALAV